MRYLQLPIRLIRDRLAPFVLAVFAGDFNGDVAEPAVGLSAVPVLDVGGDHDDAALLQADGGLALFLIPALACGADQQLAAALGGVVDVPVVAAARLKGNVGPNSPPLGSVRGFRNESPMKNLAYAVLGVPVPNLLAVSKASLDWYFIRKILRFCCSAAAKS